MPVHWPRNITGLTARHHVRSKLTNNNFPRTGARSELANICGRFPRTEPTEINTGWGRRWSLRSDGASPRRPTEVHMMLDIMEHGGVDQARKPSRSLRTTLSDATRGR